MNRILRIGNRWWRVKNCCDQKFEDLNGIIVFHNWCTEIRPVKEVGLVRDWDALGQHDGSSAFLVITRCSAHSSKYLRWNRSHYLWKWDYQQNQNPR